MFNVAFVVSSTDALRRHRPLLRTVTENAARMLSYEERRCGYVSREVTAVRIRNIFLSSFVTEYLSYENILKYTGAPGA
jgi:hypothetical protein